MEEYQAQQFDGTLCGKRNCAACSCAMAIYWATGGAVKLSCKQVRELSGRSCVPMDPPNATHSKSGGLYISDVEKVCEMYGVSVDYGRGSGGALRDWSRLEIQSKLERGYGMIALGDAQAAPISPTTGEVYHSIFVHGFPGDIAVHSHDPRLAQSYRVPLAAIMRYMEADSDGKHLAGFVPPSNTGGGAEMAIPITLPKKNATWGMVEINVDDALAIYPDGSVLPLPRGTRKESGGIRIIGPADLQGGASIGREEAHEIPELMAFLLRRNVREEPALPANSPDTIEAQREAWDAHATELIGPRP
jgi:hypothetical protein